MNISVLQGVNLKNPITTIEFTAEGSVKPDIIEMVNSFHPVFLHDYSINGQKVSIHSKLPKLWVEIAEAINNEAKGEWSMDFAKKYVKESILAKQIKSMSTIPILQGAHNLGHETILFFIKRGISSEPVNRHYAIGVGQEAQITVSVGSSKDSSVGKQIQRDKWMTNTVIERLQLPIAKWANIASQSDLKGIFDQFKKPVVIKPSGLAGGSGVSTMISTYEEALKAYQYAAKKIGEKVRKDWQKKIMIQEQIEGEDYRILVIDGVMEIATKRIPAFVIGNGVQNVKELIEKENSNPDRDIENPAHILKPIVIDEPLTSLLSQNGKSLEYTPSKEEVVQLRREASMSRGGVTEDFTPKVHPQIKYIVETLAKTLHTYVLGVDVLCKDISKPLTDDNGSIIECNTMPEAYLNSFPTIGTQYPQIGEIIVKGLLKGVDPTKKIVFIGGDLKKVHSILKMNLQNYSTERIGLYSDKKIYINEMRITDNVEIDDAVEALKLNASLSTVVFHYNSKEEVERYGLGFDQIDKVYISSELNDRNPDILETLQGYKNLGIPIDIEVV